MASSADSSNAVQNADVSNKTTNSDIVEIIDDCAEVIDLEENVAVNSKCINYTCKSGIDMFRPPEFCLSFYRVKNKENKKIEVCRECYNAALNYYDNVVSVLQEGGSLVNLEVPFRNDMVEIDDSDSDGDEPGDVDFLNDEDMALLNNELDETVLNTLKQCDILKQKDDVLQQLTERKDNVVSSTNEISTLLKSIQKDLDSMSIEIYSEFNVKYEQLPSIEVLDGKIPQTTIIKTIQPKTTNVKSLVKIAPKPDETKKSLTQEKSFPHSIPEEIDLSDVTPNLPPKGKIIKEELKTGQEYYIARNMPFGSWIKGILADILPSQQHQTLMYVFNVQRSNGSVKKCVSGKEVAYLTPASVQLDVGTRIIAAFHETSSHVKNHKNQFYPGIVAEPLAAFNRYRYLIFFDDGYAQYVAPELVHLIYVASKNIWEDINEGSRSFIKKYLETYPERPMVKLQKNQHVQTEYNGKWLMATVRNIDCSLVQMSFEGARRVEWIYRGSTRLSPLFQEEMAASNRLRNSRPQKKVNQPGAAPYVQYTRNESDNQSQQQRAVARKSTAKPQLITNALPPNQVIQNDPPPSKIVYYTPRKQKPNVNLYTAHTCSPRCKEYMLTNLAKLKGYAPLAKPLLCGFHRMVIKYKSKPVVWYKGPCGRTLRNMPELHQYLRVIKSNLTVDLFDFDYWIRCLAEFMLEPKIPYVKDMSNGIEEVPIQMVNYVNDEKQEFTQYSKIRIPMKGVNLNLDPEFLIGCDCEDDCSDRNKCACWQLTLGAKKYYKPEELQTMGYHYRRLPEPVSTGIYECNSRCKCSSTCLNRVVQNPLQHKLQVFRTQTKGWGIRCLHDIPQGAFVCVYAGLLLTDEMANQAGKKYGDEYYAELDYIECTERYKEDYEAEVVDPEQSSQRQDDIDSDSEQSEVDDATPTREDRDFVPSWKIGKGDTTNMKTRLRRKDTGSDSTNTDHGSKKGDDETVTISDDEETDREQLSFNPMQTANSNNDEEASNSVRDLFGENESSVYIMDAKTTGNIGRFLNHSCSPNIFVQNVFVDTHDPRFPWVAFFASNYIRAGTELTWSYNYDVGSVPGKILYCYCNSTECKGRLL